MRILLVATIVALLPQVYATEPGQRIRGDDLVFVVPGLHAESFLGPFAPNACDDMDPPNPLHCSRGFPTEKLDADGNFYFVSSRGSRHEIWRQPPVGAVELVAYIETAREVPGGVSDRVELSAIYTDAINGFSYVRLTTTCGYSCAYENAREVVRIRGLRPLIEKLKEETREHRGPWR